MGREGIEPLAHTGPGLQPSGGPATLIDTPLLSLVPRVGLAPTTVCLQGSCSANLSYPGIGYPGGSRQFCQEQNWSRFSALIWRFPEV